MRQGQLGEKVRSERPVSQSGPNAPGGVVGAGLMRFQACSLKPRVPLWWLTQCLNHLTKVCTIIGPTQMTSLCLSQYLLSLIQK